MTAKPHPQLPLTHAHCVLLSHVTRHPARYIWCILYDVICILASVLAAAEIIPGMEAPSPQTSQEPLIQDSSGESFDESSRSFNDSSPDSRRNSNKNASSSGSDGTTPSSLSSNGSSNSRQSPQSKMSGNGSGNGGEGEGDGSDQQQQGGGGNKDSGGNDKSSLNGGLGAEQAKQAVSIAGNKMQQAAQEEGVNIASRSVLANWHC